MTPQVMSVLAVLSPIATMIFGYAAFRRNANADLSSSASREAQLMVEIGYIKSGIDELKRKQERQEEQYTELITRITAVEASAKQAHHRLDTMEHNCESRRE